MGKIKPIILHKGSSEERWNDELRGHVQWRTLFSSERTPSEALTAGVAEIPPGSELKAHRHAEPELYYIIEGEGVVPIDGLEYPVQVGTAVFIPGDATHRIENRSQFSLRLLYVFAADSFNEVEYVFPG